MPYATWYQRCFENANPTVVSLQINRRVLIGMTPNFLPNTLSFANIPTVRDSYHTVVAIAGQTTRRPASGDAYSDRGR